jgi:hypothetical protein
VAQTYTIIIDEDQRLLLIAALHALKTDDATDFIDMLTTLPKDESDSPGVLHGFCL